MSTDLNEYINNLHDKYTLKLLDTVINTKDIPLSHYELLCPNNTILKDTGYTIVKYTGIVNGRTTIGLFKDNELQIGYEFKIDIEDNTIKVTPIEIH